MRTLGYALELTAATTARCVRRGSWDGVSRRVLVRHLDEAAVTAIPLIVGVACVVGAIGLGGMANWLAKFDQTALLTGATQLVVGRIAPFVVALILIARTGPAASLEIKRAVRRGELGTLASQGIDPFSFLVLPRVVASALACAGLTAVFAVVAVLTGWAFGWVLALPGLGEPGFPFEVLGATTPLALVAGLLHTCIVGAVISAVSIAAGERGGARAEDDTATVARVVVSSISAVLVAHVLLTLFVIV